MADIFQEIDEELRQDKAARLWKKYCKYLIVAALGIVVLVAGYRFWKQNEYEGRERASALYERATSGADSGNFEDAIEMLTDPIMRNNVGYAVLSKIQQANFAEALGDYDAVLTTFKSIAEDENNPIFLRDFSRFNYLSTQYQETSKLEVPSQLDDLIDAGGPWSYLAREMKGLIALDTGDKSRASSIFQNLVDDANTPKAMRNRMTELLKTLP